MPICETCSVAITKLRPQEKAPPPNERDVDATLPRFGNWILRSCWVCSKFYRWLEVKHPELFNSWHKKGLPVTYAMIGFVHADQPLVPLTCVLLLNITVQGLHRENDACEFEINLIPREDFVTRPFALPKRRLDLTLSKQWIESCRRNHVKCEENINQWYPTRLLHFGLRDRRVTLVISKDHNPKGPYITLSHRWGQHMKVKLTTTTMARLQQGVQISSLSRVFRDSVVIAQQLGIHYLWIDALCIIQDEDDLSDWNLESKDMNKVYTNALVNISATLSQGDESLFQDRDLGPALPSEIQLDIGGTLRSYFAIDGDIWRDEIDNAPLNKRGWVFQERFSARRVLHFGHQQLAWECRELEASEMFPDGLHRATTASYITKSKLYEDLMNQPQGSGDAPDGKLAGMWRIMVENYTKCGLTFPKDKLIAFDGVAQAVMTSRGGRCVAGVWQNNIAYDLTWSRDEEAKEVFPITETSNRAPSWSWASVDGPVYYPTFTGKIQRQFIDGCEILEPSANGNASLSTHPSIRVQGHCLPLQIRWSQGNMTNFETSGFRFPLGDLFGADIDVDGSEEELQELVHKSKVHWLPLSVTTGYIYGIVLAKVRGIHVHRRVGAIEIPIEESFHSGEMILKKERDKSQFERFTLPAGPLVEPAANDRDPEYSRIWNVTALRLVYQIAKLKPSEIFIC